MSTTRRLWLQPGETVSPSQATETHAEILDRCAIRPAPVLLWDRISNSLVVGQEFILTCLFLAGHRIIKLENSEAAIDILQPSLLLVWTSFVLVIRHNQPTDLVDATQARSVKIRHRTADGIFMAILLRFLAAVLKTLTASYSTDTVYALAISGFVLHLLACDYSYANGVRRSHTQQARDATQRPAFQGGTLSLTAAFFATILLASRLESNVIVYIFVSSSVVLFALYPAARHQVAINTQSKNKWVPLAISFILATATFRLLSMYEMIGILLMLILFCGLVPLWQCALQAHKVNLVGPWVLVHPTMETKEMPTT